MKHIIHRFFRRLYFKSAGRWAEFLLKQLLRLFVPLYRLLLFLDQSWAKVRQNQLPRPVISVGNISVGGTGKTAFVQSLLEKLLASGKDVAVLKRGEGNGEGVLSPGRSEPAKIAEYGDEVAVIRRNFPDVPIGVGKNRFRVARRLLTEHPVDVFVLDDGFQRLNLQRSVDVVLLGGVTELDEYMLPAGPLREPPAALERADLISVKGESSSPADKFKSYSRAPVFNHYYQFQGIWQGDEEVTEKLRQTGIDLVTTLARPGDLVDFLEASGFEIREKLFLPDHAALNMKNIRDNFELSRVVMTEKELVKLPPGKQSTVGCVKSQLQLDPEDLFWSELNSVVEEAPARELE